MTGFIKAETVGFSMTSPDCCASKLIQRNSSSQLKHENAIFKISCLRADERIEDSYICHDVRFFSGKVTKLYSG